MQFATPTVRLSSQYLRGGIISFRRQASNVGAREVPDSNLPPPRLDYKSIAENVAYKSHNAFNRRAPIPVGAVQSTARLYDELKYLSSELNQKLALRNATSDLVRRTNDSYGRDAAIEQAKALKIEISDLKAKITIIESDLLHNSLPIPNDTHSDTPIGSEAATVTLSTHGPDALPATPSRDHVRVARHFQMLDLDAGSTVTGSSWYFLLNEGALLELALINYALSVAIRHGYKPVTTPDVVKLDIARRCGFQPRDPANNVEQMYHLASEPDHPELVLSGTAEIPLAGLYTHKVLEESQLPLKVVGVGKAFRAEAGARGADTRGLYRVHQFSKVELFAVEIEARSDEIMEDMRKVQVDILDGLKLPFRVLDMPTEELGASAYRKYDMEAWMPGRGRWGEVTSTSNCTDYQSRRLHIRYRRKPSSLRSNSSIQPSAGSDALAHGEPSISSSEKRSLPFAHTLNGTAAAIPRLIVALLENGVRLKGDDIVGLDLPKALHTFWLGGHEESKCNIRWI